MWTLGKFVVMTHDELEQRNNDARALGYRAGLRSKWKAKKNETEQLLDAIAPGVVLPSRNAETYASGPTIYGDSLPIVEDAA